MLKHKTGTQDGTVTRAWLLPWLYSQYSIPLILCWEVNETLLHEVLQRYQCLMHVCKHTNSIGWKQSRDRAWCGKQCHKRIPMPWNPQILSLWKKMHKHAQNMVMSGSTLFLSQGTEVTCLNLEVSFWGNKAASWCWHYGNVNTHCAILTKCLPIHVVKLNIELVSQERSRSFNSRYWSGTLSVLTGWWQ